MSDNGSGSIPVLHVRGRTIAAMWENSMIELYHRGKRIKTEYDAPEDPPSIDATMTMTCDEPFGEPMIHKAFPGGPADLEEYVQEVCDGIKDHWVDLEDPTKWKYTYHGRLTNYQVLKGPQEVLLINQIQHIAEKLSKSPHSRRCYAPTGQPWIDWSIPDPPCCLGVWFRIMKDDEGHDRLNMNVTFRSRDAYDAAYMNAFAFVHLQARMASMIATMADRPIFLGRYCDQSYSYHIYGRRLRGALPNFEQGFLGMLDRRQFEDREDPSNSRTARLVDWMPMMSEARPQIAEKVATCRA